MLNSELFFSTFLLNLYCSWVNNREDSWIRNKTNLLIPIDSLDWNCVVLTLHFGRSAHAILGFIVSSVHVEGRALAVFLRYEKSVLEEGWATWLSWFVPWDHDGVLRERLNIYIFRLGYADDGCIWLVELAVFLNTWLVQGESAGVRNCDSLRIDPVSTLETESNPILFSYICLVEWKIDFIDWSWMFWGENLHLSENLLSFFLACPLELLDISFRIHQVIKVANFIKFGGLNCYELWISIIAILS